MKVMKLDSWMKKYSRSAAECCDEIEASIMDIHFLFDDFEDEEYSSHTKSEILEFFQNVKDMKRKLLKDIDDLLGRVDEFEEYVLANGKDEDNEEKDDEGKDFLDLLGILHRENGEND